MGNGRLREEVVHNGSTVLWFSLILQNSRPGLTLWEVKGFTTLYGVELWPEMVQEHNGF